MGSAAGSPAAIQSMPMHIPEDDEGDDEPLAIKKGMSELVIQEDAVKKPSITPKATTPMLP